MIRKSSSLVTVTGSLINTPFSSHLASSSDGTSTTDCNSLLESLVETLALHHGFHVLRYNSRGAGRSSGSTSFTGFPEVEDLKDVVQFSVQRIGNVKEVVLIGYSNGSLPVSMHPVLPEPIRTSHVLLSYPLGPRGFLTLFNTRTYQNKLDDLLRDPRAHVLVIYGNADTFTGVESYDQWTDRLKAVAKSSETRDDGSEAVPGEAGLLGDRLVVKRIEGGTHFWTGNAHRDLVRTLHDFLEKR
ncbi:hypothetical protein EVG20_g9579 [Dentipellis fragilis]|uniref:AB hydrolase-1 domain-containing protein n=1 Tax=Dentipellis fragilis TaxID=205917 RepID=A0A4Y9XYL2_9AGAM|nr:hypothetical protein EVG20_g9579 [Dentipellis fragilis]